MIVKSNQTAEAIGDFREALGQVAEGGPSAIELSSYQKLRKRLLDDEDVSSLMPDFVIECRTPRNFWDYIQRAFSTYSERSRYIEAHLLPAERQFRPERQRAPGQRPPEVRVEYSPVRPANSDGSALFCSEDRIAEFRTIQSADFDLRKLVRLCEEINVAYSEGCYLATIVLVRAMLDHVPPIFEKQTFAQVASNYGGKSFKAAAQRLENGARRIADGHLHQFIRASETLPTSQQVSFSAELDVLLSEVARILK